MGLASVEPFAPQHVERETDGLRFGFGVGVGIGRGPSLLRRRLGDARDVLGERPPHTLWAGFGSNLSGVYAVWFGDPSIRAFERYATADPGVCQTDRRRARLVAFLTP